MGESGVKRGEERGRVVLRGVRSGELWWFTRSIP